MADLRKFTKFIYMRNNKNLLTFCYFFAIPTLAFVLKLKKKLVACKANVFLSFLRGSK